MDRQVLLQYKKALTIRDQLVTTYHLVLKDLGRILRKHLPILRTKARMADVFKDPSMASFRRPRNLKDMVVKTRLDYPLPNGGFKTCTELRCQLCRNSSDTDSPSSPVTCLSYRILGNFSYKTHN
jgi:hypothetical protein